MDHVAEIASFDRVMLSPSRAACTVGSRRGLTSAEQGENDQQENDTARNVTWHFEDSFRSIDASPAEILRLRLNERLTDQESAQRFRQTAER